MQVAVKLYETNPFISLKTFFGPLPVNWRFCTVFVFILLYRDPTCLPLNVSYRNTQEHSSISYPDKRKKLLAGVIVGAVEQEQNKPITVRRSFRYKWKFLLLQFLRWPLGAAVIWSWLKSKQEAFSSQCVKDSKVFIANWQHVQENRNTVSHLTVQKNTEK